MDQPVIIVTGASQGIGSAVAEAAAENGARVVLVARNHGALEQLAQKITARGGTALAAAGDVTSSAACVEIVRQALDAFGRIDALVNNAAVLGPISLLTDSTPEEWMRTLEVNLFGPVNMCRAALPHLRRMGGRVINISSGAAEAAIPAGSAYCTSKAALNHFTRVLCAEELAVTVMAYNPGDVNTPMQAELRERGQVAAFEEIHRYFVEQYEQGSLIPAAKAGQAVAALALSAPPAWSGELIHHDEERVLELTAVFAARPNAANPPSGT